MQTLKEKNGERYGKKINEKYKTHPEVYEKIFDGHSDELSSRKDKHLTERVAVKSFFKNGFPILRSKKRCYSPDWNYSLIFIKQEEKRDMKKYLQNIKNKVENLE